MRIHLIFNAHLDPVWLWPWQAGLDEVLATCRSACDRLDTHPDLTFSRGEAWVYRQIERVDPPLFQRITGFIRQRRWEIVGGWWIQPDCNLPSGFAFKQQIDQGKDYFLKKFGQFPKVGYNVDSFGHAATLPGYLSAAGQPYYVMMRPQEHEMPLPSRLFRWRGYQGGPEVITFRIANGYGGQWISEHHIGKALEQMPPGIKDTMCFVGVGDHGGGPTEKQIAWLRENWNAFPGHTLLFSTPSRFFKAVARQASLLPLVTGELQMHAVGCYSVYRPIKTSLRRAEHLLDQAERIRAKLPTRERQQLPELQEAWRHVAFNQFHDTLGGTCIPSAYPQVLDQIGSAAEAADQTLQTAFRYLLVAQGKDPLQRIAIHNPSSVEFHGYAECEPWREWQVWKPETHLLDPAGHRHPFQRVASEALVMNLGALLFPVRIGAGKTVIYRIAESGRSRAVRPRVFHAENRINNNKGISIYLEPAWRLKFGREDSLQPDLQLIDDRSDTWSHDTHRYGRSLARATWQKKARLIESGPLRASYMQTGRIGASRLRAEWRLLADMDYAELVLRVLWAEKHRVLKLTLPLPRSAERRTDGIMGGELVRPNDGRELPFRDWTRVVLGKRALGVVAPDVYALDGSPKELRFTLLRSPLLAHHDPASATAPRGLVADQGEHEFRFRFFFGKAGPALLENHALTMQQPLLFADLTNGMPTRFPH